MCRGIVSPQSRGGGRSRPKSRRPSSGRAPLWRGETCAAGKAPRGGLSDPTAGAGAHVTHFFYEFSSIILILL